MHHRLKGAALLRLLALVLPLGSALAQTGMSTPGQFSVNESGAATYTIPLTMPPGIGGIEPKLALSYNSQAGNGLLGVGWSLSGLSAIGRCPQTMAQDGKRGGVKLDNEDRYCLDGQRLMAVNGTYGADGTEYRTERESFSKIISYGVAGNGRAWFKVWTKAGQVMEYGNTADSRIEAIKAAGSTATWPMATVRQWALNKLSDTKGNYFKVSYTEDQVNGDYYPKRIDYTGNDSTNTATTNAVVFEYEVRLDVIPKYSNGSQNKNNMRLMKIISQINLTDIKKYTISYEDLSSRKYSYLAGISECSTDGKCNDAMKFKWKIADPVKFNTSAKWLADLGRSAGWTDDNKWPRLLADVNGDGLADVVVFDAGGVYVALNSNGAFLPRTLWLADFGSSVGGWSDNGLWPRSLIDVNGDGLVDVVGIDSNGIYVSINTGSSFQARQLWLADFDRNHGWTNNAGWPRSFVDVNGDGLIDVLGFGNEGVYVGLNTGTSFQAKTLWSSDFGRSAGWTDDNKWPRLLADVNGDGLVDVVGFDADGVYVSLNTGIAFQPRALWLADFGSSTGGWSDNSFWPRSLVDVNGDGLVDVVGIDGDGVYVGVNTGTSFQTRKLWLADFGRNQGWTNTHNFPRMFVDINGDGMADIVAFDSAAVYVSLSNGTLFQTKILSVGGFGTNDGWTNMSDFPRTIANMTSGGALGITGFGNDGVYVAIPFVDTLFDQMYMVESAQEVLQNISYKSLIDKNLYTKDSSANSSSYPKLDVQAPMYVVSSVSSANGAGGIVTTNYKYGGLKAELGTGRGMLGFRWLESTQVETSMVTRNEFRQDWPYTGLVSKTLKSLAGAGNNGLLNQVDNTYGCTDFVSSTGCTLGAGKRYYVYGSQSTESSWDANGAALPTIITASQYDIWGNATQVSVSSSDGYSKVTNNTYSNDVSNWYLGRLSKASVTSTAP